MGAFTPTLDSLTGADNPGGTRAGMHPPGPAKTPRKTGPCAYCQEDAELFIPARPCQEKMKYCIPHYVANAKRHANCRRCFNLAQIRGGE